MVNNFREGFESQYDEVALGPDKMRVEGEVPKWIDGTIVHNGPGQFELGDPSPQACYESTLKHVCYMHWFDGLAMPHQFTLKDGTVSFANKYMRTETYTKDNRTGQVNFRMAATSPVLTFWQKLIAPFYIQFMDNTNVHTVLSEKEYIAWTERTKGWTFDLETLETIAPFTYDNVKDTEIQTAHPHYNPDTNIFFNLSLEMGLRPKYKLFWSKGRTAHNIATINAPDPSYMHSFGMTENYLILAEYPFRISFWAQMQFLFTELPIFTNYAWDPQTPTYFTIISKRTGEVVSRTPAEPFFCFHHINAFEVGDEVVIDVSAYADSTVVQALFLQTLKSNNEFSTMTAEFRRYRVNLATNSTRSLATFERIMPSKEIILPRINYNMVNTKPYKWTYGISHHEQITQDFTNQLVKIDVEKGYDVATWHEHNHYPGEPVFAPHPDGTEEDDGVVLSTVFDADNNSSYLLILDGKTFEERARVHPEPEPGQGFRVPFAFHGRWYSKGVMY